MSTQTELLAELSALRRRVAALEAERGDPGALARFRALFHASFQLTAILAPDGTLLELNRAALELGGLPESDVVGVPFWEAAWWRRAPAGAERLKAAVARAAAGEAVRYEAEVSAPDGEPRTIDFSLKPVEVTPGTVAFLVAEGRDVTDRQQARRELEELAATLEERVQARTAELRSVVEATRDGFAMFSLGGAFTDVNDAFCRMIGYSRQELLAMNIRDVAAEASPEEVTRVGADVRAAGYYSFETRHRRKDGRVIDVEATVNWVEPLGRYIALMRDVTPRKEAELARARQLAILEATPDLVSMSTPEGVVEYLNLAGRRLLGVETLEGMKIESGHPPWAFALLRDVAIPAAIRDGVWTGETAFLARDGREVPALQVVIAHRDARGAVAYLSTLAHDISETKRAALELSQSEVRNRALLDAIPDTMFLLSADGVFLDYHSQDQTELLVPPQSFLGRSVDEVLPAGVRDSHSRAARTALETGRVQRYEYPLQIGDELRHFEGRVVPCGKAQVLAIVRDVTDRVRADEELRLRSEELGRAVGELERVARAKDEFLASMSHELRTPLNGILGMAELLRGGIQGPLNEKQLRSLTVIEEGGRHLLALINDVLDVAKIEAGRLALQLEPQRADEIAQASLAMVRQMAQRKRIELTLTVEPPRTRVRADGRRLKQMLVNLLSNAVKFTPEGGRVGLEVEGDLDTSELRFTVWDTGIGIAEEDLSRLFQPFSQLDARLGREHGGTGLGLVLVRRMAELHGGRVSVESEKGNGSRFSIFLPWTPVEGKHATPTPWRSLPPPLTPALGIRRRVTGERPLVLVVEDDPAAAEVLVTFLPTAGFQVEVAPSGPEALELVTRCRPEVILMDIQLPGMDGFEVIRRLRAQPQFRRTPIVALTALAMTGDRERILAAGADDYLSKPIPLETLADTLRSLLARVW